MNRVLQSEVCGKRCQIIRIMVHIVPISHLRRASMPTPVMRYHAIALTQEEQHLVVPVIGRKRPPMAEYNRLPRTPVLIENLNAVFGRDGGHVDSFDRWQLMPGN